MPAEVWRRSNRCPVENTYFSNKNKMLQIHSIALLGHQWHALGDHTHVDTRFPTILEGTGDIHHHEQNGEGQPLSLLYPVDREALQALYGRLDNGDDPTDFGPWASTSLHVVGNSKHANFGVALRNGYAEPWAYGLTPSTNLANNSKLGGGATWKGTLLGFTPEESPVSGDAEISINLATMNGRADFTSLESFPSGQSPGASGAGTQWLDSVLGYTIAVDGNTFRETGGDDGRVTGIFVGRQHEGAAGTLERTDLTAAFGAERE